MQVLPSHHPAASIAAAATPPAPVRAVVLARTTGLRSVASPAPAAGSDVKLRAVAAVAVLAAPLVGGRRRRRLWPALGQQGLRGRVTSGGGVAHGAQPRSVKFTTERNLEEVFPACSSGDLNALMESDAAGVLFGGGEGSSSQPVDGPDGHSYVFFPPVDIGPFRAQVRLTCTLAPPAAGRAEVSVLETNPGLLDNDSGEIEYQADPNELIETTTKVVMRWRQIKAGLRVSQEASQRFC